MKKTFLTLLIIAIAATSLLAQRRRNRFVTGDLRIHEFESKVFNNTRKLRVFVPAGYKKSGKSYPVLYLNDGQNLFDPNTSQVSQMEWGVDETVLSLVSDRKIERLIVVGIDNVGRRERANEYLPWKDEFLSPPLENPEGAKYPGFVIDEVMPFIEKEYRVKTGPENTGLGGSSYGALISLFTVLERPGIFGKLILESPSFYVDEARILKMSETAETWPAKIHLGVGTNELENETCDPDDESHEAVTDVRKLEKILDGKTEVEVIVEPCAVHSESAWGSRFSDALEFLFPYKKPTRKKKN